MDHSLLDWVIFWTIIISLLALDLGVFHKKERVLTFLQSSLLSLFYFFIACLFGLYVFYNLGSDRAGEYFTGFLIEKAMALDNIFIISMIFRFFVIPVAYQQRVLLWGILGVIVFRAIMISLGVIMLTKFSWILYIFAFILIVTGIKIFYIAEKQFDVKDLYIYKLLQRNFNITNELHGDNFFVRIDRKLYATPLFVSLVLIEFTDLIFAIDSIPAIFAITKDPYIIYTSNVFAILGLRALFFCLGDIVERFKYVKYSLASILVVIGIKIFAGHFILIPTYVPLLITIFLLASGIVISIIMDRKYHQNLIKK